MKFINLMIFIVLGAIAYLWFSAINSKESDQTAINDAINATKDAAVNAVEATLKAIDSATESVSIVVDDVPEKVVESPLDPSEQSRLEDDFINNQLLSVVTSDISSAGEKEPRFKQESLPVLENQQIGAQASVVDAEGGQQLEAITHDSDSARTRLIIESEPVGVDQEFPATGGSVSENDD